jgi:hypothetical protein
LVRPNPARVDTREANKIEALSRFRWSLLINWISACAGMTKSQFLLAPKMTKAPCGAFVQFRLAPDSVNITGW